MKTMLIKIPSILAALLFTLSFASCDSDEPNSNSDWDWDWDEKYERGEAMLVQSFESITPTYVVWHGERLDFNNETKAMLAQQAAMPCEYSLSVKTTAYGELKKAIGTKALDIDQLIVSGPIDETDLTYIKRCAAKGNLRSVDLTNAVLENNEIPNSAFLVYEYPQPGSCPLYMHAYLPIFDLKLPDGIILGKAALCNVLLTHIDLSPVKRVESCALLRMPMLTGVLDVPPTIEYFGDDAFALSGDGNLVVNYNNTKMSLFEFSGANIKEINLAEGITEINGLCGLKLKEIKLPSTAKTIGYYGLGSNSELEYITLPDGLEVIEESGLAYNTSLKSITLPASLKKIEREGLAELTALQEMRVLFSDPAVAYGPATEEDFWDFKDFPWAFFFWGQTDLNVYVPAASYDAFCASPLWRNNFKMIPE